MRGRKQRPSRRRERGGKAGAERAHARRRFRERHGLEVSERDLDAMVGMVQRSEGRFVRRSSNARAVWEVDYEGRVRRVVYDRNRKQIVTVLDVVEEED